MPTALLPKPVLLNTTLHDFLMPRSWEAVQGVKSTSEITEKELGNCLIKKDEDTGG